LGTLYVLIFLLLILLHGDVFVNILLFLEDIRVTA
jgi:hypothetical protein